MSSPTCQANGDGCPTNMIGDWPRFACTSSDITTVCAESAVPTGFTRIAIGANICLCISKTTSPAVMPTSTLSEAGKTDQISPSSHSATNPASTITPMTSTKSAPTNTGSSSATNTGSPSTTEPPPTGAGNVSTASSPSVSTSVPKNQKTNGISPGATAGIGVGCAFAGAVIAGLLLFFLFRRKRGAKHASIHPYPDGGYLPEGKIPMGATSSSTRGGAVSNIDRLLPQPAEDDAILGALSRIRDGIKNHVQNYYHQAAVRPELVDETEVFELAQATGMAASTVRNLLLNPATRIAAIRLYLAQLILSSCGGNHDYHASFLPQEIAALAASLSATENTKWAQPALFSKWKTITGALLQRQYGQALGDHDTRNPSVNRAMETAESVLRPFLDPGVDMHARRRNLEGTIKRAAQLAFLLFSQPASFHFDYSGTGQSDRLLVFPALLQIVSDEAEVLSPPRVLSEPEELDMGGGF